MSGRSPFLLSNPGFLYGASGEVLLPSGAAIDLDPELLRGSQVDGQLLSVNPPNLGSLGLTFERSASTSGWPWWYSNGPGGKAYLHSETVDQLSLPLPLAETNFLHELTTPYTIAFVGRSTFGEAQLSNVLFAGTRSSGGLLAGLYVGNDNRQGSGFTNSGAVLMGPYSGSGFIYRRNANDTWPTFRWHSMVLQWTGSVFRFYVDEQLIDESAPDRDPVAGDSAENFKVLRNSFVSLARFLVWKSEVNVSQVHAAFRNLYGALPDTPVLPTGAWGSWDAQSVAGLADDDNINTWSDESGNSRDLISGFETTVPARKNTLGGHAAVDFGDTQSSLRALWHNNGGIEYDWPVVTIGGLIWKHSHNGSLNQWLISSINTVTATRLGVYWSPGGNLGMIRGSILAVTSPTPTGAWTPFVCVFKSTRSVISTYNVRKEGTTGSYTTSNGLLVGKYSYSTYGAQGALRELHIYKGVDVGHNLEAYLTAKLAANP